MIFLGQICLKSWMIIFVRFCQFLTLETRVFNASYKNKWKWKIDFLRIFHFFSEKSDTPNYYMLNNLERADKGKPSERAERKVTNLTVCLFTAPEASYNKYWRDHEVVISFEETESQTQGGWIAGQKLCLYRPLSSLL